MDTALSGKLRTWILIGIGLSLVSGFLLVYGTGFIPLTTSPLSNDLSPLSSDEVHVYVSVNATDSPHVVLSAYNPAGCREGEIRAVSRYEANTLFIDIVGVKQTGPQEFCDALIRVRGYVDISPEWLGQDDVRRIIVTNTSDKIREYEVHNHGTSMLVKRVWPESYGEYDMYNSNRPWQ